MNRLDHALAGFDEAPIFTIHSFCQRTLKDRAFESGALFDTELITDEANLFQDVADDYWRKRFYESGPLPVAFALKNRLHPEKFLPLLREHSRHPLIKYVSRVEGRELDALIVDLEKAFAAARSSWLKSKDTIVALANPAAGWAKGDHKKLEIFAERMAQADACFESVAPTLDSLTAMEFFSRREIREDTNAKSESPAHEFFDLCDVLCDRECDFLAGLKLDFVDFACAELPRRKRQLKAQSYGDLLTSLHAALDAAGGDSLVREVRAKYQAALIDEFQDTDPVQYQIFRRLFSDPEPDRKTEARAENFLFLIGDPKQAIYGFRGADIFTYLDAASRVDRCFTLEQNWRSETPLVRAVNTVFGAAQSPFVFDEIHFQPVQIGRAHV